MRTVTRLQGYSSTDQWLRDYVEFMTTPDSHNDTYAESYHRDFFANYARGVAPAECAKGTEGHNTAQIGGFVVRPPLPEPGPLRTCRTQIRTLQNFSFASHATLPHT